MRSMSLVAAAAVGLLVPLSAVASPASGEATADLVCKSRSWTAVKAVVVAGRRATLWKCDGQFYFHGGLVRGGQGDLIWVSKGPSSSLRATWKEEARIPAGRTSVSTAALVLGRGESAWVCAKPAGYGFGCSKAHPFKVSCPSPKTTTTTTVPAGCRD